ncbi:MAG TPA: rRNA adenine N-6-methyltransferase family protein, partial [Ktedonobacteraceae bacterium]|nr:rRNA adenine N-6-methyltransferase family protein [Ktedonobacteraceae bacterium]
MNTARRFSHSTQDELAAHQRQQLVDSLLQIGAVRSPALEQAFLSIPREAFVPYFYEQETTSRTMAWKLVSAHEMPREDYLAAVYRNASLVTKIDERSWPVSSSSLPSIMATMLEALDVHPGQRVLEIGTGSGYNAALLATLTDTPEQVVTIERDAVLAAQARHTLEQVIGPGVTVVVGDGVVGWPSGAPYDRIIATASAATLPIAWVEQLDIGGRLVMDLQGPLASSFLVVEKTAERVSGHFLSEPLHFMPLETEAISLPQANIASLLQQACQMTFVLENDPVFPDALFDPAFRWFLQWRIPDCQVSKRKHVQRGTASETHTILIIEP